MHQSSGTCIALHIDYLPHIGKHSVRGKNTSSSSVSEDNFDARVSQRPFHEFPASFKRQYLPPVMADVRFEVKYNCAAGANATIKRNSLVGDGPLKVHHNQYFAVAFPASMKTVVDGHVLVNMHSCEYLTLAWMIWATELQDRNLAWYTLPTRFASLLSALEDAGKLIWKEYEDFDVLAEDFRKAILALPDELRKLRLAECHTFAIVNPAAELFDRIKAKSLARRQISQSDKQMHLKDMYTLVSFQVGPLQQLN